MKKRKRRVKNGRDRLSELPDSLISHIFSFSDTRDVVRTTILSKRWKNLWTTVQLLDFNDNNTIKTEKFRNLVDGAVNSWRGIKMVRFSVKFDRKLEKPLTSDIDSWMHFAIEKKVEDLRLLLPYAPMAKPYELPQFVYSCSSLKVLFLGYCDLEIHGKVQWNQLNSLTIQFYKISENGVDQILSGTPLLEYFFFSFYDSEGNLSIKSSSLKRLCIRKFSIYKDGDSSADTELGIWTPNLETLDLLGVPYRKCLLMDISSLTTAFIGFDEPGLYWHVYGLDFVGKTLSQILPKIKHVQTVILSDWCIKTLGGMKEKYMVPPFPNANSLTLNVCSKRYNQIVDVVEMFPKLGSLVLKTTHESLPKHAESSLKFDRNLQLNELRTVEVSWSHEDNFIFPLIQILLKHATNLEKMVFREKGNKLRRSWKSLFEASQKLLQMERSSATAKLIFY